MKNFKILFILFFCFSIVKGQTLNLTSRKKNAKGGSEFAKSIADSSLTLEKREELIFNEIKQGNIPDFLRKLQEIKETILINDETFIINYYVAPDYFLIGSNDDFFYVPMTPILAQKIAELTKCSLPTKQIVNQIYQTATIKLEPQPLPPTKAMTTVSVFLAHTQLINTQLALYLKKHNNSALTAGNKKDIIVSNKIYGEKTNRVVIYGWHKLDGKAIQPLYNKHVNTWADYSHGVRLVQNKVWINGKKTSLAKVLADEKLNVLLSDEGIILKPFYPITGY